MSGAVKGQPSSFGWHCVRVERHESHREDGDGYYGPGGYICSGEAPRRSIYDEIRLERERAHAKHGATSMELTPVDEMYRAVILGEEIGEVAEIAWLAWSAALTAKFSYVQKAMNDGRHDGITDTAKLRKELVQVATMAAAWADRIPTDDPASAASTPVPQAVAGTVEPTAAPATRDVPDLLTALQASIDRARRYAQCDDTCTVDCGHCKGNGVQA